jgi:hypothetical protein
LRQKVLQVSERSGRGERDEGHNQSEQGHRDCNQVESEQAPLLLLLIGDVERGDHRRRTIGAAVHRDQEGQKNPEPLGLLRSLNSVHQLVADDQSDIGRQHCSQRAHVLDDGERIRRKTVNEDDQAEQREQRKETVESYASRYQADIVIPDPLIGPGDNILPRGCRHFRR